MEKVNDQNSFNPVVETKVQPKASATSNPSTTSPQQAQPNGSNKIDGIKSC
ncbi:MAG: hypothetical protein MTP17_01990 [Candidatus Midichloria sp.]|nr:MAG: hypothetical protein MTP17_01990 [Candidatus Midichloria sp.]